MLMATKRTKQGGFITTELIVSIALLGLALAGLAVAMQGFSAFNHYAWTRQRCTVAAEAQLDSLAATGKPIDRAERARLWPEVDVVIDRVAGQDSWGGLELVRVTATGRADARKATVRLERYVRREGR